ncbi:MAG: DUF3553 domain-containing protein [Dongiaceae bacterium]
MRHPERPDWGLGQVQSVRRFANHGQLRECRQTLDQWRRHSAGSDRLRRRAKRLIPGKKHQRLGV